MKRTAVLPDGYREIYSIDLAKNKIASLLVNGAALIVTAVMGVCAHFFVPIDTLFSMESGFTQYSLRFAALIVSLVAYIILHEAVHGIAMKICGTKKIKYGVKGPYAFAGSDDYYAKRPYIFIALAPVVLWGAVLAVVSFLVPREWFWVAYIVQIANISGAAGDAFVTVKFAFMPRDILVKDYGVGMTVYSKES